MKDNAARLARLKKEFAAFLKEIYPGREKVAVFGEGNAYARVMLVGEAPGQQETLAQRPFVGKAGKNLDEFLALAGMQREQLYITNVVKFRPVKVHPRTGSLSNRPPDREEIALCQSFLFRELGIIQPKVVVTLGNTALRAVLDDKKAAIGELHGAWQPGKLPVWAGEVYPLYHPASIIYNRTLAPAYRADVQRLGQELYRRGWIRREEPQ